MRIFTIDELPWKELDDIGISKDDFLELPISILNTVLLGRLSPIMMLKVKVDDNIYSVKGKFAFERDEKNVVQVKVFPIRNDILYLDEFTEEERELLKNGRIVKKKFPNKEGKKVLSYVQLDPETLCLISLPISAMFIPGIIMGKELTDDEKEKIKDGQILEIEIENQKNTITVDLVKAKSGIISEKIDEATWRMERAIEWDRINPASMGYWQTSQNGWEYQEALDRQNGIKR